MDGLPGKMEGASLGDAQQGGHADAAAAQARSMLQKTTGNERGCCEVRSELSSKMPV